MRLFTPLLLTFMLTTGCNAGEADIKKNLETRFPGMQINSVNKTPVSGLYEVIFDGSQIVYSDAKGNYLIDGVMVETSSRRNLTREKADKLSEIKFDSLPLDQAIKVVKGDGKRVMAVFSDPDCPYCRKLEQEIAKLDNLTVHVFAYPLPMHTDASRKSKLVWCSANRAQAWLDLMLEGKVPEGNADCPNPLEANLALGQKLNIQGTPAIILANGKRLPGLVPADRLDRMLDEATR